MAKATVLATLTLARHAATYDLSTSFSIRSFQE